ncbi:MAG: hypothetical protein ACPKPY_02920 [Nitrososphaeraceae archaeon]
MNRIDVHINMEKEERKEYLLKEIDIIQSVINRMSYNSFLIKGWTITLVVGILLLDNIASYKIQVSIAFIPLILFWLLDSYFLWKERLYRKLYEWVINNRKTNDDHLFSMNVKRFEREVSKYTVPFSWTFLLFYGGIFVSILIYLISIYIGLIKDDINGT